MRKSPTLTHGARMQIRKSFVLRGYFAIRQSCANNPSIAVPTRKTLVSGAVVTNPAVLDAAPSPGPEHAASTQNPSVTIPTDKLELLISMVPPASVRPAGGTPPTPVKKAIAGSPLWFDAFDVRKRASAEFGLTPVQLGNVRAAGVQKRVRRKRPSGCRRDVDVAVGTGVRVKRERPADGDAVR